MISSFFSLKGIHTDGLVPRIDLPDIDPLDSLRQFQVCNASRRCNWEMRVVRKTWITARRQTTWIVIYFLHARAGLSFRLVPLKSRYNKTHWTVCWRVLPFLNFFPFDRRSLNLEQQSASSQNDAEKKTEKSADSSAGSLPLLWHLFTLIVQKFVCGNVKWMRVMSRGRVRRWNVFVLLFSMHCPCRFIAHGCGCLSGNVPPGKRWHFFVVGNIRTSSVKIGFFIHIFAQLILNEIFSKNF